MHGAVQAAKGVDVEAAAQLVSEHPLKGAAARVVVVDGVVAPELCDFGSLPEDVYLGSAAGAPGSCLQHMARTWTPPALSASCHVCI